MNCQSLLLAGYVMLGSLFPAYAETRTISIMPLGDSLTMASPGYRGLLFQLLTEAGHAVEFVGSMKDEGGQVGSPRHEGHGGFTIGPGKSKADEWSQGKGNLFDNLDGWMQAPPDVILLLIGTNEFFNIGDLQPGYKPNEAAPAKLGALLDKIHSLSPVSKVIISSILPVEWDADFAQPINQAIPGLVASRPFTTFADLKAKRPSSPATGPAINYTPVNKAIKKSLELGSRFCSHSSKS